MAENPESVALAKKLKELESLQAQIRAAQSAGTWIRVVRLLGIIALLAGVVFVFWKKVEEFIGEPNLKKLQAHAERKLKDPKTHEWLRGELQKLVNEVQEPVTNDFTRQMKQDSPKFIKTMNAEADILLKKLPGQIEVKVEAHYEKQLKAHVKIFEKEFPELKDNEKEREKIIGSVAVALTTISKKYYAEQVERESKRLLKGWETFPVAERARASEDPLTDQLMAKLLELMWYEMASLAKDPGK